LPRRFRKRPWQYGNVRFMLPEEIKKKHFRFRYD
jgi:hypothetical protein